jgi:hypothetical protein
MRAGAGPTLELRCEGGMRPCGPTSTAARTRVGAESKIASMPYLTKIGFAVVASLAIEPEAPRVRLRRCASTSSWSTVSCWVMLRCEDVEEYQAVVRAHVPSMRRSSIIIRPRRVRPRGRGRGSGRRSERPALTLRSRNDGLTAPTVRTPISNPAIPLSCAAFRASRRTSSTSTDLTPIRC